MTPFFDVIFYLDISVYFFEIEMQNNKIYQIKALFKLFSAMLDTSYYCENSKNRTSKLVRTPSIFEKNTSFVHNVNGSLSSNHVLKLCNHIGIKYIVYINKQECSYQNHKLNKGSLFVQKWQPNLSLSNLFFENMLVFETVYM